MKLVTPRGLASSLYSCHLLLDTNVFFHAVDNDEFYSFLLELHNSGCSLMTIPSVVFEFARGAKSVAEYNWYVDYINNLGIGIYTHVEEQIVKDKAFSVILQTECKKVGSKAGYTDFLLMMLLHKFSHMEKSIYLMTSNYQDIPLSIFDRNELLALEFRGGVQTQALYKNSLDKLGQLSGDALY